MTGLAYRSWEQNGRARMGKSKLQNLIFRLFYYFSTKTVDPNKTLDDAGSELLEMYIRIVQFPFAAAMATQMRY
jgi:hypothetical protein